MAGRELAGENGGNRKMAGRELAGEKGREQKWREENGREQKWREMLRGYVSFSRQNCAGDVARLLFGGKIGRVKFSATKTRNRVKMQKNLCFIQLRADIY